MAALGAMANIKMALGRLPLHPSLGEQQQLGHALKDLEYAMALANGSLLVAEELQREDQSVARFLRQLKDVIYDAEDLLDELEYEQLRRKVEELNGLEAGSSGRRGVGGPSTVQGSVQQSADGWTDATCLSIATNKAASLFRNAAQKIPSLIGDAANPGVAPHLILPIHLQQRMLQTRQVILLRQQTTRCSFSSTVKSCKPYEDSHVIDIASRIKDILSNLNCITEKLKKSNKNAMNYLQLQKLHHDPRKQFASQSNRTTDANIKEHIICEREYEKKKLMKMLLESDFNHSISIFPILGMGGIGKTTLARWAYNSKEAEKAFEVRAWVFVSDAYSKEKIIKDILEQISNGGTQHFANLTRLQREVHGILRGKKFLLVLDDLWSDQWTELLESLQYANSKFIKIVVTSRDEKVFNGRGKKNLIDVKPLEDGIYWSLFLRCVFENEDPNKYSSLHSIGREIVKKLKGLPLAAETVGRLLRVRLDDKYWDSILKSNMWELSTTDPNDIMPTLALSYNHLSKNLQRCFAFCSVYPKDFAFEKKKLISMWVAQGYVETKTNFTPEEVGEQYFGELLSQSLLEQSGFEEFKMHDLLHDLVQSVSLDECFVYDGQQLKRNMKRVRHLCISTPIDLNLVCNPNKLRTLIILKGKLDAFQIQTLTKLRALALYDRELDELSDANGGISKHLRCLDLSRTHIKEYPESWCKLYHLRSLFLPKYLDGVLVPSLPKLIGRMTCLVELETFIVGKECGYEIGQLKNMNALRGNLCICNLKYVRSRGEAGEANLKHKRRLNSLELCWRRRTCFAEEEEMCSNGDVAEEILEGLQPHANLSKLFICGYSGSTSPNWFSSLQNLQTIGLYVCKNWARLPPLGQLPFLHSLFIRDMQVTMDGSGDDRNVVFPSLEKLKLKRSSLTLVGVSASTAQGRCFFPSLWKLTAVDAPPGQSMKQQGSERVQNDFQLPSCIPAFTALRELNIQEADDPPFSCQVFD